MAQTNSTLGQKINLDDAQEMLSQYDFFKSNVQMTLKDDSTLKADPQLVGKANVFMEMTRDFNAFVFTKDLLMRFFDGSESDDDLNPQVSNFLLVILGAHKEDKIVNGEEFKGGSFTVLTAGCTRKTEIDEDNKKIFKFYPLSTPLPANEYPPQTRVRLKAVSTVKIDGTAFDHFEVIE